VDEIFATVETHAARLNYVNVSTAWHRLASICRASVRASGGLPTPDATAAVAAASAGARADPRLRTLEAATLAVVPMFGPQNISNTLWGAAGLLHMPPPPLLRALALAARASLPSFTPHALANTAWAAATLRWPGADTLVAAVAREADRSARLDAFAPQGLSNLLWACATVGVHPGEAVCDIIGRRVAADAASFKAQELSAVAWAWAQLRHHPGRRALSALDASLAARLPEFAPQAISNVLWAAAVLQHRPDAALAAVGAAFAPPPQHAQADATEALAALPEGFCTQDLANLAWSLALLDAFALPLFSSVWAVARVLPPEAFAEEGLRMLFQTVMLASADAARGGRAGVAVLSSPLSPPLGAAAEAAWRSQVDEHIVNDLHGAVCAALRAMSIPHSVERLTDDALFSVDVAIEAQPQHSPRAALSSRRRIALEVDGPYHFTSNSRARTGPTRCRDTLLRARGWEVLPVPFFEWATLRNVYEQKLYLRAKLAAMRVDADALAAAAGTAGGATPWATLRGEEGAAAAMTAAPGACVA
jgi:hypothetical protein